MPLSELHAKFEASKSKPPNCAGVDPQPYTLDGEFLELLWENGQIVMQGGANSIKPITTATRRTTLATAFPSIAAKMQEKGPAKDDASQRLIRFGASIDHIATTAGGATNCGDAALYPASAVSGQPAAGGGGFGAQDDDLVPWVNCPFDEYYSEFLGDFPGVNVAANSPLGQNGSLVPGPAAGAAAERGTDSPSTMMVARNSPASLEPPQKHQQQPTVRHPSALGILVDTNGARIRIPTQFAQQSAPAAPQLPQPQWPNPASAGNSATTTQTQTLVYGLPGTKAQGQILQTPTTKPPLPPPSSSSGIVNFSHFSRPSVLHKASDNTHTSDRLHSHDKASTAAASSNPMESSLVESSGGFKSYTIPLLALASGKGQAKQTTLPVLGHRLVNRSDSPNWKDASTNSNNNNNNKALNGATTLKDNTKQPSPERLHCKIPVPPERKEPGKPPDTVVASSSVCSGIGAGVSSNDPRSRAKRKIQDGEESGYQSEDLDDESVGGVKKQSNARVKRSRAAEVHNLSERRRRDRINEKMRALQELIPNCNKVDKASMLDEAIEYLKTLQLQIQIMSMGNGMCMPHMMMPTAMQQLRQPHLAHMPHLGLGMGMGMGMGMGYGMGMVDMNGSPLMPSAMQGPQFPYSMMAGTPGLHGIPGSNGLQMFGMPTQGIPIRMPSGQPYPSLASQPTIGAGYSSMMDVPLPTSGAMHSGEIAAGCLDGVGVNNNFNSDSGNGQGSGDSDIPLTMQATTECADQSVSTQFLNQTSNSDDPNSSSGNGNSSTGTSYG